MTTQGKRIDDPLADQEPRESDYGTDGATEIAANQQIERALNGLLGGGVEVLADGSIFFDTGLIEVVVADGRYGVRPRGPIDPSRWDDFLSKFGAPVIRSTEAARINAFCLTYAASIASAATSGAVGSRLDAVNPLDVLAIAGRLRAFIVAGGPSATQALKCAAGTIRIGDSAVDACEAILKCAASYDDFLSAGAPA